MIGSISTIKEKVLNDLLDYEVFGKQQLLALQRFPKQNKSKQNKTNIHNVSITTMICMGITRRLPLPLRLYVKEIVYHHKIISHYIIRNKCILCQRRYRWSKLLGTLYIPFNNGHLGPAVDNLKKTPIFSASETLNSV